jgi:hypothetical protein
MSKDKKSYRELKNDLQNTLDWFVSQDDLDIEEASKKYDEAKELIVLIEDYLSAVNKKLDTAKPKKVA